MRRSISATTGGARDLSLSLLHAWLSSSRVSMRRYSEKSMSGSCRAISSSGSAGKSPRAERGTLGKGEREKKKKEEKKKKKKKKKKTKTNKNKTKKDTHLCDGKTGGGRAEHLLDELVALGLLLLDVALELRGEA